MLGLRPSPYQAVQVALVVKRMALGNPKDEENVFQWSHLAVNLPGNEGYIPGDPWIAKLRMDGTIAVDVHSHVDDERVTGSTNNLTWGGSSKLAKLRAHLGLQHAAGKHQEPSQEPGPWARVVIHSRPGEAVCKLVTQMRWDRTKRFLGDIRTLYDEGQALVEKPGDPVMLDRESTQGFLVYVA
jgi:hypothetical protein